MLEFRRSYHLQQKIFVANISYIHRWILLEVVKTDFV